MMPAHIAIDEKYTTELLQSMVRINSVNPSLSTGGPGEVAIVEHLAQTMRALGLDVAVHEAEPGRPSVVGRLRGTGGGRSLMLNGHVDTVAVDEMVDPFAATI